MSEWIKKPRYYEAGTTRVFVFKDLPALNQAIEKLKGIQDIQVCINDKDLSIKIVTSRGLTAAELEARLHQLDN